MVVTLLVGSDVETGGSRGSVNRSPWAFQGP